MNATQSLISGSLISGADQFEADLAMAPLLSRAATDAAANTAIRRIAPLWPLRNFVAVNPYLGLSGLRFAEAAQRIADTFGSRMTPDRKAFAAEFARGRFTPGDIEAARAEAPADHAPPDTAAIIERLRSGIEPALPPRLPTVSSVVEEVRGTAWPRIFTEHLGAFAARHFDEGEAAWAAPARSLGLWQAFQHDARHDRSLEIIGLSGVRDIIASLPANSLEAINICLTELGLSADAAEPWLHRLLADIAGWAGHARYRLWQAELDGRTDTAPIDLLAARLACETALLQTLPDFSPAMAAWTDALTRLNAPQPLDTELVIDAVLQRAREIAHARELAARLATRAPAPASALPAAQLVFCIDVRSERLRRALEGVAPDVQTLGFAGFFGIALDHVPFGQRNGQSRAPVLLKPGLTIPETVTGSAPGEAASMLAAARLRRRTDAALAAFKRAAVASFAYVESLGPVAAFRLVSDSLGLTRPAPEPATAHLSHDVACRLGPDISGMPTETMIDAAEAMLRGMSLTDRFAPLLILLGHGSRSANNPHATGLDCGACGGHDGAANARVAAMILNQQAVREGLAGRGIHLPKTFHAVAGLHDTTTDDIRFFDICGLPEQLKPELARIETALITAAARTRIERSEALALAPSADRHTAVRRRANDWSQVRPEWGLANCAAFIAAPRQRTRHLDLDGRTFLHDYDCKADAERGYPVLTLIMTAPMVVASWISLQYYGSSLDNQRFGAGNKLLHNAIGAIGVQEGQGGDLRPGLPFQSVHAGDRPMHEPLRLLVVIEAPTDAIDAVIESQPAVAELVENQWVMLMALQPDGHARRWSARGRWL
jgi:uncharacterized protein YbcC (UPF0753/DUF2309 family)